MGDIADMMINGFLCEGCGVYLDGEEPGYPRRCSFCRPPQKSKIGESKSKRRRIRRRKLEKTKKEQGDE